MTSLTTGVFAGWGVNQRNKCRSYSKRFVASARVFYGWYDTDRQANCDNANASVSRNCAWQKTSAGWNGFWQQGRVNNWFCSRGETINALEYLLLPQLNNSINTSIEESTFKSQIANFDEATHSIIINGITGKIKLENGHGFSSNLRLSVWQPNDDDKNLVEDEIMDDSEILNQFEIKLTDDGVVFNGNLTNSSLENQFIVTQIGNDTFVEFTNVSITIPIDKSVSLENLAIRFDGDGAPDTSNNIAKATSNTNTLLAKNEFSLTTFPNPTTDIINLEFTNNKSIGLTVIEIYNNKGVKVKDVFTGNLNKGETKSISINLSNLPNDNYLVLIQSDGKKLIRQIVKQ